MRCFTILVMVFGMVGSASAQQLTNSGGEGVAAPTFNEFSDLPLEKIGNDDLVGITVYDATELTRAVRVGSDGDIRLPMLREHIKASGLYLSLIHI